jgi:hypothetical protein
MLWIHLHLVGIFWKYYALIFSYLNCYSSLNSHEMACLALKITIINDHETPDLTFTFCST